MVAVQAAARRRAAMRGDGYALSCLALGVRGGHDGRQQQLHRELHAVARAGGGQASRAAVALQGQACEALVLVDAPKVAPGHVVRRLGARGVEVGRHGQVWAKNKTIPRHAEDGGFKENVAESLLFPTTKHLFQAFQTGRCVNGKKCVRRWGSHTPP